MLIHLFGNINTSLKVSWLMILQWAPCPWAPWYLGSPASRTTHSSLWRPSLSSIAIRMDSWVEAIEPVSSYHRRSDHIRMYFTDSSYIGIKEGSANGSPGGDGEVRRSRVLLPLCASPPLPIVIGREVGAKRAIAFEFQ